MHLEANKAGCALHYPLPLHLQKCYTSLGHKAGDFPVTEKAASECLSLPIYPELTDDQVQHVATVIKRFLQITGCRRPSYCVGLLSPHSGDTFGFQSGGVFWRHQRVSQLPLRICRYRPGQTNRQADCFKRRGARLRPGRGSRRSRAGWPRCVRIVFPRRLRGAKAPELLLRHLQPNEGVTRSAPQGCLVRAGRQEMVRMDRWS